MRAHAQHGYALIAAVALGGLIVAALLITSLSSAAIKNAQNKQTAIALAQAKEALLGYAVSHITKQDTGSIAFLAGWLPCPDYEYTTTEQNSKNVGSADTPCGTGSTGTPPNANFIGRLPWKTLGLSVMRDGASECLWYAVSGNFKNSGNAAPDQISQNSIGTLQLHDATGAIVGNSNNKIAAIIFAPGIALPNQNRSGDTSTICGNVTGTQAYDATKYLEALNTPLGNFNNATAGNTTDDFVTAPATDNFNDQIAYITVDDITNLIKKSIPDLPSAIANLSDTDWQTFANNTLYTNASGTLKGGYTKPVCSSITPCENNATYSKGLVPFGDIYLSNSSLMKLGLINYLAPITYFVSTDCLQTACADGNISVVDGGSNYDNAEAVIVIANDTLGTRTISVGGTNIQSSITIIAQSSSTIVLH